MANLPTSATACSVCGEPLGVKGACFACLLRAGLDEADPAVAPEAVVVFDDFEIARREDGSLWELGRGGMGVTYRATERTLHRSVALKVIDTHGSEAVRERFLREARAAAALRHPNVAAVFRFGALAGGDRCYCAMELVEGETLEALVRREGSLKLETALEIAVQVTRALIAAAERGLVHRDLKPGNIMLTQSESSLANLEVKVIDFGLAKAASNVVGEMELTRGEFVGTPAFASPEQFAGGAIDARTDIYALGMTLWFALTSRLPFAGRTIEEVRQNQSQQKLPLEQLQGVPRRVIDLLRSCLAIDPAERPVSAKKLLEALESCRTQLTARRRNRKLAVLAGITAFAVGIAALIFWRNQESERAVSTAIPEKSIAVLPFENLSEEKANAYFAEGVQDEILTRLAAVRELKVISRTSTAKYKSKPDNIKKVAEELGVSTILEGSVQKAGDKVRINVQLIDARTDTHLWAKSYDRDLKDVFAVESEVSQEIADSLRIKLSPEQSGAMASVPTKDTEAYDLFLRGEYEFHQAGISVDAAAAADRADAFYRRALARDPNFVAPAVQLARSRLYRHWYTSPLTPAELEEVKAIIDRSLTLAPNSPEAHLALGLFFYWGHRQYEMALAEFKRTLELQPNNVDAWAYCAWIHRRRGEWEPSLAHSQRAQELAPRDASLPQNIGSTYLALRLWKEAQQAELRALALDSQNAVAAVVLVHARLCETGDASSARQVLNDFPEARNALATALSGRRGVSSGGEVAAITGIWVYLDVMERRFSDAFQAFEKAAGHDPRGHLQLLAGRVALRVLAGEAEAAKTIGEEARPLLEAKLSESPEDTFALTELSWVYLALGRGMDALRVSRKAADLVSIEKDALDGPIFQQGLAQIEARAGAPEQAIKRLRYLLSIPSGHRLSKARLKSDPVWDPIRDRPDFQQLLSGPEQIGPVTASTSKAGGENQALVGPPEKSIAVLPFENLSGDPDNAYFAEGIQDEILTRLSKISELKVISRTSTRQYKSATGNVRDIAKQLGVGHILEGSVRKSGDAVRVNVQLINAANDTHIWAETFDRKMTDILAVESEVAKAIADQLRAKLTGQEEQEIAAKPTENSEAYDAYLRGLAYTLKPANTTANTLGAQKYLREAVRLDPKFALAWALLSSVNSIGYRTAIIQRTPALREEARQAAETALSLQPNLGEAVLAKGYYHYGCLKDYDTAIRYFEQARQLLPNDSRIPESLAYVTRRRGQWEKSESYFNEAERLDVRNANLLTQHALSYMRLRRFPEALRKLDHVLNITPDDVRIVAFKASIAQAEGELLRAATLLAPLRPNADDPGTLETQVYQAILERRPEAIIPRLREVVAKPDPALGYLNADMRFWLGWAEETAGDHTAAQKSWQQARSELETYLKEEPDNFNILSDLALTNMGLGDKAAAFAFAERAIAANPLEEDAVSGSSPLETLARVAARMGEPDRAIAALQKLLSIPAVTDTVAPITVALLRLDPMFDSLRSDPRFQKLTSPGDTASTAPAEIPEKSIAVLPFENRSRDPDNEFFTDGVQDEILTDLARIAALKVISRTSVMQYKTGAKRNLRQIGKELGVAHVLEGSVQRAGNRVRVIAQLIDARTDAHLWAQTYDRDLTDVFAIQSEIAKAITGQLRAKLSPGEESAIERPPTTDITAFNLYSHAKNLFLTAFAGANGRADLLQAADLLKQAVARDPSFFQAYCQLAFTEISIYGVLDHSPAFLAQAEAALQSAARLRPDAGETHLARARNLYWGYLDYDGALRELEIARQSLPGEDWIFSLKAYIERRQGRWEECIRDLERAIELDPRNVLTLQQLAITYEQLRRYSEQKAIFERILAFAPNDPVTKSLHAFVELDAKADTRPLREVTDSIRDKNPAALSIIADTWLLGALAERDPAAARSALIALGENPVSLGPIVDVRLNRSFIEGVIARMAKDEKKAGAAFTAARTEQEKIIQAQPNHGPAVCALGLIDAALGRKEEALRQGRRAVELLPVEKDAMQGAAMVKYLAMIAAWVGEKDLAFQQLAIAIRRPGDLSYGQLKLMPFWDPLRGDPRFAKILVEAERTVAGQSVATTAAEKSIAVLPFENLSEEKANEYFAAGIQDEIMTRLAAVRDLKVISRTSTAKYKSKPDNLKKIGEELGVSTLLEGSVQKAGDKVRINVQLIDAASDSHLWAETFDRKLTDIFAVESEVAKAIVDRLQAKLTGDEEKVIVAKPTENTEAYDAYLRGLAYSLKTANTTANALNAQKYLKEAVRLDPKFAAGWALLSFVNARGYRTAFLQRTPALQEEAREAAETALALQPNLGDAILAKGFYHYACLSDYDTALRYFEEARPFLPNSSRIPELLAYVTRRQGQWDRSESFFNEAERLDPRNVSLLTQHALSYKNRRLFPEALRKLEQILNIAPDDVDTIIEKTAIAQAEGDLARASTLLAPLPLQANNPNALETQVYQAILERRPAPIVAALKDILAKPDPALGYTNGELRFWLGWAQQVSGDHTAARESWGEARRELESFLKEHSEDPILLGHLALVAAGLGDRDAAFARVEQAQAALPMEKDAVSGPRPVEILARVAAQLGEADRAVAALQKIMATPYSGALGPGAPLTPALLRLDPMFDRLRGNPRFEELCQDKRP